MDSPYSISPDGKQRIKKLIKEKIQQKKDLKEVKENVKTSFKLELTENDSTYIGGKYVKYCAIFWFNDVVKYLENLESNREDFLKSMREELFYIDTLNNVPKEFRDSQFFELLQEHRKYAPRQLEMSILAQFKEKCLAKVIIISTETAKEYRFFQYMFHVIDSSKTPQKLISYLKLNEFCSNSISVNELLECIVNLEVKMFGTDAINLKRIAKEFSTDDMFLIPNFKKMLKVCIDSFKMTQTRTDGREVVEIKGRNIAISEILENLENVLKSKSNIEEVRLICNNVHIDANLMNQIWHGKNIIIRAKRIAVHDKIVWDVSGLNNDHVYHTDAGTKYNGDGEKGEDGFAGESGGNILILTNEMINSNNFVIISNGGNGSKGQNGGNGRDGADGKGLTWDEFEQKFPSVIKVLPLTDSQLNYTTTISNIRRDGGHVGYGDFAEHYVNTTTKDGNQIIFSCNHNMVKPDSGYLVYKGSPGKPGSRGGEYGFGGQGGYAGELMIKNYSDNKKFGVTKNNEAGRDGGNGKGGLTGKHGKHGWDRAYKDHQYWRETEFYGQNNQYSLTIEYESSGNVLSDVWCYQEEKYVTIKSSTIQHHWNTKNQKRNNMRQSRDHNQNQNHSQAMRKKNVCQSSILANYRMSELYEGTLNTQDSISELEIINLQATQAYMTNRNHQQQQQQQHELNITRLASYNGNHYNLNYSEATFDAIYKHNIENTDAALWFDMVKTEPEELNNWLLLKNVELDQNQLNILFDILKKLKTNNFTNTNKFKSAKNIILSKYKNATLYEISQQFCLEVQSKDALLEPEETVRYLVLDNEKFEDMPHSQSKGSLNEYLFENDNSNHRKFGYFVKKELQSLSTEVLTSFISENMQLATTHDRIMPYYKDFLATEKPPLGDDLKSFLNWMSSGENADPVVYFKNAIENQYDWKDCCKDENVLKEFQNYIENQGPLSESYREQLALEFKINIRVYVMNQSRKLMLQNNHNPASRECIQVLLRNNKFSRLCFDEKLYVLEKWRIKKNQLYGKLINDAEQFEKKDELDKYLMDRNYLPQNSILMNIVFDEQTCDEGQCIEEIISYFEENEKEELKPRLEKLMFEFIGKNNILLNLQRRFHRDGRHVSFQELCFLINSVLLSQSKDRQEQNIFCWIISASPQRCWIDELLIVQLENHFKSSENSSNWRQYLSKIENVETLLWFSLKLDENGAVKAECIENCLYMLSNTTGKTDNLKILDLTEWPNAIKEKYWTCKILKGFDCTQTDPSMAVFLVLTLENRFGTKFITDFLKVLMNKNPSCSLAQLCTILSDFNCEKWTFSEAIIGNLLKLNIDDWVAQMNQTFTQNFNERDVLELEKLITTGSFTSPKIIANLATIRDRFDRIRVEENVAAKSYPKSMKHSQIKAMLEKHFKPSKNNVDIENKLIAVIDRVIELKRGFKLRDTQKLAVHALLTNDKSTLAEVSTGEGKSLIVAVASLIKVLRKEKVHIVTSSSVLAKRDAEINKDIYSLFGVDVGHNCCENPDERKNAYSNNQVVYGDLSSFQRDFLLDKFYGINMLGDQNFDNVIVDEVDSMLLDKGNNMLYLSHNMAGIDKLNSVYIFIWNMINLLVRDKNSSSHIFEIDAIKQSIMNDIFGTVTKDDIQQLDPKLEKENVHKIWLSLCNKNIVDDNGKLLLKSVDKETELQTVLTPDHGGLLDRLIFLLKDRMDKEKAVHVPNYLVPFVEKHLSTWIESARSAFFMIPGQHYVVDSDKTGLKPDLNPIITILDTDTGTDQANSQWDGALHQFLQLKHGCKLSLQNLKAVYISNVSYFKRYKNLYGLTGTLGSDRERGLLQEIYDVDFVVIPTAKPKQFVEQKQILASNARDWIEQIHKSATEVTTTLGRSILVICETVKEAHEIKQAFGSAEHIHTYTRDYEEFEIAQGTSKLETGQIIIATNLAGRGTDIKLTEQLQTNGGLHVCLTYLPSNIRIEQQAFGRAARSGNPGSGQLIFYNKKQQQDSDSKPSVWDLKKQRDREELCRLSEVKTYYETQIVSEETCFEKFKQQYEDLKKNNISAHCLLGMKNRSTIIEILFRSVLDRWAFWLDKNNSLLRATRNDECNANLEKKLDKFISQLQKLKCNEIEDLYAWVEEHPVHTVKLGIALTVGGKHESAIKLFDQVIAKEPQFSEVAHYYKAYALSWNLKWDQRKSLKPFKKHLREASNLFQEHKNVHMISVGIVDRIKRNDNNIVQIKGFEEQQHAKANIYQTFLRSIDDILGHQVTSKCFVESNINEELAESLYEDLLTKYVLRKPKVKKSVDTDKLKAISNDYRIRIEDLSEFISQWEGQEIDETKFLKDLKQCIVLHDRGKFWRYLVEKGILHSEKKYVAVNIDRLKKIDQALCDVLTKEKLLEKNNDLFKAGQLILYEEYVEQQKCCKIYIKNSFLELAGREKYLLLKRRGIISFNKAAQLKENQDESVSFANFDSITLYDFKSIGISASEGNKIISELVENNILEKSTPRGNHDAFKLKIKTTEFAELDFSLFPIYETAIRGLLLQCFAYRTALEGIVSQFSNGILPVQIPLMIKPHRNVFQDLIKYGIIKPVVVADVNLDKKLYQSKGVSSLLLSKSIDKILKEKDSKLKTSKIKECGLESLVENLGQQHVEESNIFELNGIDQILVLRTYEEKSLERKSLFGFIKGLIDIASVCVLAITQIVVGVILSVVSVGTAANIGSSLVWEGIGDLIFAFSSSPHDFKWSDYASYKTTSMTINSFFQFLPTMLIKRPMKNACDMAVRHFSRFTHITKYMNIGSKILKLIIPRVESYLRKIISRQYSKLQQETAQYTVLKARRVLEISEANIDMRIKNSLNSLCERIESVLVKATMQVFEQKFNNMFSITSEFYQVAGNQVVEKNLDTLQKQFFSLEAITEQLLILVNTVTGSVIKEIKEAIERLSNMHPLKLIDAINKEVKWSEQSNHETMVQKLVDKNLDTIKKQIEENMSLFQSVLGNGTLVSAEESEKLTREKLDQWKALLSENLAKFVDEHIESSIIVKGTKHLMKFVSKCLQSSQSNFNNELMINRLCNELRPQYEDTRRNKRQKNVLPVDKQMTEKYHAMVLELMMRNKNSKVYAAAVRENIPMDAKCAAFLTPVLQKVLQKAGITITGLTLAIVTENSYEKQLFSTTQVNAHNTFVKLTLSNNRFYIDQNASSPEANDETKSQNNCLYNALSQIVPKFKKAFPNNFAETVATFIEQDKSIQNFIQQRKHQNWLAFEIYEGSMLKSSGEYSSELVMISEHIVNRFVSFIRFGGILQIISEKTTIARDKIVGQSKDLKTYYTNAVRLVRAGEINQELKSKSACLYDLLNDFLCHSQNVPCYADLWYDIDKFQACHSDILAKINFSQKPDQTAELEITALRLKFLNTIGLYVTRRFNCKQLVSELIVACEIIATSNVLNLHEEGSEIYDYLKELRI